MPVAKYKRVLLKLSGEQFASGRGFGIDSDFINELARDIKAVADLGVEVVIIVGGGNFMRGADIAKNGVERATGDYMGMLATILNGMALVDTIEAGGQAARLQTRLRVDSVAEPYIRRRAIRHLEKKRIVIVAGGTGNPYVTTDTAAVTTALELDCQAVLKATKVDGVYDKDPVKHKKARKYASLSHSEALRNPQIGVMDNAAISLAMDNNLPIVVFKLSKENLKKVIQGKSVGTKVGA